MKFKKRLILPLLAAAVALFSCDFYKIRENQVNAKFLKAGLEPKDLALGATTVHYWTGGTGRPLVLIHGFGADSRFQWYDQVPELSKKFTLVVPDLVYFSESRSTSNNFSVDFQADTIIGLLRHLKIDRFSMMGVSYGGLVAITVCDRMPDKVDRLILSDSPIKYYTIRHNEAALKKYNASTIQELLVPKKPEGIPRLLELAYYDPPWVPGMVLENIHGRMFKDQAEEKGKLLEYLKDNEARFMKKDYRVDCGVLLIWGRHDLLIPPEIGYKLKDYLKDKARLEIIDKTAHMPNLENPERFNALIGKFLEEK